MTLKEIEDVWEIEKLCFSIPWSLKAFMMEVEENKCAYYVVAKREEKVIGYGGMWIILDEAHVTNIAVHPNFRRQGVGEAIIRNLMEKAVQLGIDKMTLEVRVSNHVAQNLYRKVGFKEAGIRKGYYTDTNEDALIMWNTHLKNYV